MEAEELGFAHADVGTLLAAKWQLAPEHVKAIRDHHAEKSARRASPLLTIVCAADQRDPNPATGGGWSRTQSAPIC